MSADFAIRFENVGKEYRVGAASPGGHYRYQSLGERLGGALRNPFRAAAGALRRSATDSFWALKDVSFEVKPGEVVGVIGRNGAGKSTLLKILSQITKPTEGQIAIRGRVGSLLEVGTGFHPELTGRENIFLNGAILGMTQREVRAKFDEIVAFSEVERFLDTPVKQYSSGMYTRLAFAVAAHLDPEILVVDEVLAVGDAEFQKKCLGKMQDVASGGRTVLFVSHNMGAVQELCNRGCLLSGGRVVQHGPIDAVVRRYMAAGSSVREISASEVKDQKWFGPARILRCGVTQDEATNTGYFDPIKPIRIYADIKHQAGASLSFGVVIRTAYGLNLLHVTSQDDHGTLVLPGDVARLSISIPAIPFSDGDYSIMYFLADRGFQPQHILNDAVTFTVDASHRGQRYAKSPIVTPAEWTFDSSPMENAFR